MITVKKLKEALAKLDDDTLVVVASDPEGNDYRLLGEVEDGYNGDLATGSNQYIEISVEGEVEELSEYTKEELKFIKPVCILWPGYIDIEEIEED